MTQQTASELINLSMNIKRLREERGWSQGELAAELNTKRTAISRWEHPLPSMNLNSLQKLADVFGVSIVELFQRYN